MILVSWIISTLIITSRPVWNDLIIAVVDIRNHRRHGGGKDNALVLQTEIRARRPDAEQLLAAALFGGSRRRQSRESGRREDR